MVVFSISRQKIYNRLNDIKNLFFNSSYGPFFGENVISIENNILRGYESEVPFKISKNS
jgi:hypothetical protein